MIESVSIKNFSIIRDIEINLHPGLNVIYGESGSGKSLILYAISVIFGESFNQSLIREGEKKSILTCNTTENSYQRVASKNNNLCSIDGINVPLKNIKTVKDSILQIHSQGDQEELYSKGFQLYYIDSFIDLEIKKTVSDLYKLYSDAVADLQSVQEAYEREFKQQEFYKYQIEEIEKIKPFTEDEEEQLSNQLIQYSLLEKNLNNINSFKDELETIEGSFLKALRSWEKIKDIEQFKDLSDKVNYILDETTLADILYKVSTFLSTENDAFDTDSINNRIYELQKLKKKLGCKTLKEVVELENKISSEINLIENYPEILQEKRKLVDELEKSYTNSCEQLSIERKRVYSETIIPKLIDNLKFLGFDYIELNAKHFKKPQYSPNGIDDIEFEISFNKGFSANPIRKIVSGGEASRISLALKILKNDGRTLILDEIETGLSGETLRKLAESLKKVSKESQIICISHSEEIIGYADKKIKIFKEENIEENRIETKISQE